MNPSVLVDRLERFARVLPMAAIIASAGHARWRPPNGAWSILEVVCHLADEEVEDFRTRVRMTLFDPGIVWPPIDPEGWAVQRRYNEQDLEEQVARFVRERAESVRWLREVIAGGADWTRAYQHPKFGPIAAGTLLVSWAAHDALHLRQIAKRLYELAELEGAGDGFRAQYAGEWGA